MSLEDLAAQFGSYREITNYKLKTQANKKNLSGTEEGVNTPHSEINKANNDGAVVNQIKESAFNQKLYKHISDYYAGAGQISRNVNSKLAEKDHAIAGNLNQSAPATGAMYSGYRTASFSYNSQARFISGIDSATKIANDIRKIFKV